MKKLLIVAGVCVVESELQLDTVAAYLVSLSKRLDFDLVLKASYRKANRTKADAFTGIGDIKALKYIEAVATKYNVHTLTDIHTPAEAEIAAKYCTYLQIPAFLCRQTDLLQAAAATGRSLNVKKGQFLAAADMEYVAEKLDKFGCNSYLFTERGGSFGYHDLVVDMRNIPIMKRFAPVLVDVTHSTRDISMIETIAMTGLAAGADGIYLETHPEPQKALSDRNSVAPLTSLPYLFTKLKSLWTLLQSFQQG